MKNPIRNACHLLISEDALIIDALIMLEDTQEQLLICVGEGCKLVGVLSDGDIRRSLIDGRSIKDPVNKSVRRDCVFISSQATFQEALELVSERIHLLPVVNHDHRVVGYYSYKQHVPARNVKTNNVTIVGMGYVGLTLAVCLSSHGYKVIGYDVSEKLVDKLNCKQSPFFEVGLQTQLDSLVGQNLIFTTSMDQAKGNIYIITVGTPIDFNNKAPRMDSIIKASEAVGGILKKQDAVVMRSTLPVGCSRKIVLPILEKVAGFKCGSDFFFAFAPERTAEGRALLELRLNPQIIGGYDAVSTEIIAQLFNTITPSVVDIGSLEAAELCKLIDNCFRDHLFSFTNQLVPLTEKLDLNLSKIVDAVNFGYDRNNIRKPSPGVGGPCLTKDPYILASVLQEFNLDSTLLLASRKVNESGPEHVFKKLVSLLATAGKDISSAIISIVGIAFKGEPETSDVRNSMSLKLLEFLKECTNVRGYDLVMEDKLLAQLGFQPVGLEEAFDGADAVVVMNNHRSYANWNIQKLLTLMNSPAAFIDTWNIFDPFDIKTVRGILYGGVGND